MKKLIAAVALLLSFNAAAWSINGNGVGISPYTGTKALASVHAGDGYTLLGFSFGIDCTPSYKEVVANIVVDGVGVRMGSECNTGNWMVSWYPETAKGNNYLLSIFEQKNTVVVDGKKISAVGFSKVHRMVTLKALGGI
ncbi:MAG: hypothetical protein ACRCUJ_02890 [Phocaeicola sp.]